MGQVPTKQLSCPQNFINRCFKLFKNRIHIHKKVSQMGWTGGVQYGQKLHENDKMSIFGSKQWGQGSGEGGHTNFLAIGGDSSSPLPSPPTRGNPAKQPFNYFGQKMTFSSCLISFSLSNYFLEILVHQSICFKI